MRRTPAAVMAFVLALSAKAFAEPLKVLSEGAATQPSATRFVLHSDRIGRDFEVVVQPPFATAFLPGQKFHAIYALDGGYGLAGPQGLFFSGSVMAPAIIVSVGYLPGQANFRPIDLLHNPVTLGGATYGGGGAAFEAFLLQDLKPFIEGRYPADAAGAVLFGHSAGGLFAANVFANNPNAFAGYILGSVSVSLDPGVVQRVANAAASARGVRVFLSVGGDEGGAAAGRATERKSFDSMAGALGNQPGVVLKAQIYAGEEHLTYYPKLITDGFPFVLPPARPVGMQLPDLPAAALARYAGVYDMPDGRKITVEPARDNMLTGQVTGLPPVLLIPNGKDQFYAVTSDLDVLFDDVGLTLAGRDGGTLRAKREKAPP